MKVIKNLTIFMFSSLFFMACGHSPPLKIAYIGPLTGPGSDSGIEGRDALQLIFTPEMLNRGFKGQELELLVRDDNGLSDKSLEIYQELLSQGCHIIISQQTSEVARASIKFANLHDILVLSTTVSSEEWEGKADNFFRLSPTNRAQGKILGEAVAEGGYSRAFMAAVASNQGFAEALFQGFSQKFLAPGRTIIAKELLTSTRSQAFEDVVKKMRALKPDVLAPGVFSTDEAVLLAKIMERDGVFIPVYLTAWSNSADLIAMGGSSVENFRLANFYDTGSIKFEYVAFKEKYRSVYGTTPKFSACVGYEVGTMLLEILRNSPGSSPEDLKKTILSISEFKGLQGSLKIDTWGDCQRQIYLYKINQGKMVLERRS